MFLEIDYYDSFDKKTHTAWINVDNIIEFRPVKNTQTIQSEVVLQNGRRYSLTKPVQYYLNVISGVPGYAFPET